MSIVNNFFKIAGLVLVPSQNDASRYFIDDDLVGDAAQRCLLLNRPDGLLV
jgi:hypothetical protein